MPLEAKPLFRPDALRKQLVPFKLTEAPRSPAATFCAGSGLPPAWAGDISLSQVRAAGVWAVSQASKSITTHFAPFTIERPRIFR
jgi:hypothetical protein